MGKNVKKLLIILLVLLVLAGAAAGFGVVLPYQSAQSAFEPGAQIVLTPETADRWLLQWPEATGADAYQVEILKDGQTVYREFAGEEASLSIPALPGGEVYRLWIFPAVHYRTLLGEKVRLGEAPLEVGGDFTLPEINLSQPETDGFAHTLKLEVRASDQYRWRLLDGSGTVLAESASASETQLWNFDTDYPLPGEGDTLRVEVTPLRETETLLLYGLNTSSVTVSAEAVRTMKLQPALTQPQKNTVELRWEALPGIAGYTVQHLSGGSWETLKTLSADDSLTYSQWLKEGESRSYRVCALNEAGEILISSEPLDFTAEEKILWATVFPTQNLPVYRDGSIVAYAKACAPYCVLEEKGGQFRIRVDNETGWINSSLCMVNLPDYLGGLCSYNITNSVYSIYTVHEFAIPDVTGVVTAGYEDVAQDDGSFLVPLLYPTAKKLYQAALTAREQGLRLKIYDSFRPYAATREIYDLTKGILNDPLPEATFTGVPKSTLELPAPRPGTDTLTYGWLMTGSNFVLASFLAEKGSAHNLGIALDLTLETLDTGEELQMQTAIHDLSHFSILSENNDNARLLSSIMLPAGFTGLMSEWWHFQDNQAKAELPLVQIPGGVTAEGWVKDGTGWRYRTAKGTFLSGQTATLGDTACVFNDEGYLVE